MRATARQCTFACFSYRASVAFPWLRTMHESTFWVGQCWHTWFEPDSNLRYRNCSVPDYYVCQKLIKSVTRIALVYCVRRIQQSYGGTLAPDLTQCWSCSFSIVSRVYLISWMLVWILKNQQWWCSTDLSSHKNYVSPGYKLQRKINFDIWILF